jgi:hypothetical protein
VWWRDWYEDGVNEPWDGAHQCADEVDRMRESRKMRFRKSFCVGFCVCGAKTQTCARSIQNEPNERYCGAEEGVRKCSRNKPSGEKLAHDLYFKMLSSEFHDSVII